MSLTRLSLGTESFSLSLFGVAAAPTLPTSWTSATTQPTDSRIRATPSTTSVPRPNLRLAFDLWKLVFSSVRVQDPKGFSITVANHTVFFNRTTGALTIFRGLSPAARVQSVAQAVADKVHGENGESDSDAGEDDGVLALDEDAVAGAEGVGEHRAPLGGGGAGAEAKKGEGCDVQDGGREGEGGLHYKGGHAVWEHPGEDNLDIPCSKGALRLDVVALAHRDHCRAHHPRHLGDEHDADGEHGVSQARPKHGDDHDGEQDAGEGEEHVHQAHQQRVGPASEVAGYHADDSPHRCRDSHGGEPGSQRDPCAVDHAREDVPAKLVLPEGMRSTGRGELLGELLLQRVVGRYEGREDGHEHEDADDYRSEDRQAVGEERPEEILPAAARLDAGSGYRVLLYLGLGHSCPSTSPWDRAPRRGRPRGGSPARIASPRRARRPGSWRSR